MTGGEGAGAEPQGFTAMQYYLAHSKTAVHLALACPEDVSAESFRDLVGRSVDDAPQLWMEESLARNAHVAVKPDLDAVIDYARLPQQTLGLEDLDKLASAPLHDTGKPAFRAICRASRVPDGRGVRSWIIFKSTHALMEGGDVSAIFRGFGAVHSERPIVDARPSPLVRAGIAAVTPALAALHMLAASRVTLDPADFAFRRIRLDRSNVARNAQRLGVGKRVLLFGLVSHALMHNDGKRGRHHYAYSTLPRERARLADDAYLNVRMDDFRLARADDPETHVERMDRALAARGPSPMVTQALHQSLGALHTRVHPRWPGLYPKQIFGYSPYDLVLSMLPPVWPGRYDPCLEGARTFAGSTLGTTPNCVFVPGRSDVTLNLWLSPAMRDRLDGMVETLHAFGLAPERWHEPEQGRAPDQ